MNGLGITYKVTSINTPPSSSTLPVALENHAILTLIAKPHRYCGYMKGYRQPVGLINLRIGPVNALQMKHLQLALTYYFPATFLKFPTITSPTEIASSFGEALCALQIKAGLPIFDPIQLEPPNEKNEGIHLWVPTLHEDCLHQAIAFMLMVFNHHGSPSSFAPNPTLSEQINTRINTLRAYAPQGRNSLRLLETAFLEGIPWRHIAQNTFQFGYGSNSRWFESSFTDKTPQISARLAKDKLCTSRLLHNAGLPVPEQHLIRNEMEAVMMANKIGYPVVIKPQNQDGGRGVFAHLISDNGVKKAYHQARKYSALVLLEKHIVGRDYRIVVFNGQVVWALERIPAGVTGDGISTIQVLVEEINRQPERGDRTTSALKHIIITEDVTDFLAEQGFKLDGVPELGKFIPLNRIANVSTGGTPVPVLDKVHPDNKRLVETAVNLLRLDIAGVDFISPNIEQSYLEAGGKIIEINAQPQMGLTPQFVYKKIVTTLLPNQGRIPIIVVCGAHLNDSFIHYLRDNLLKRHKNIGMAKGREAFINGEQLIYAPSLFVAGQTLLSNNTLDALVYCITELAELEGQGLPFDRYDTLFLFNELCLNENHNYPANINPMDTLYKACNGKRIILDEK